ncbi:hypothetical protein [Promicromonospora sukumoe]|uniref:hypothetical protein n=1 Tax=Promicromonospora sukumoe TaxID=88382 RepID=UPI0012F7B715|nr:hypothetical protein [Promicromonospora sukumoe]
MPGDDLLLPSIEDDVPRVLASGVVLREEAGPVLPGRCRDDAPCLVPRVRPGVRLHRTDKFLQATVVLDVPLVVVDLERENAAPALDEVTVPQVPAGQLGVCRVVERAAMAAGACRRGVGLAPAPATNLVLEPPAPDRLHRDTVSRRVLSVGQASVRQREGADDEVVGPDVAHVSDGVIDH